MVQVLSDKSFWLASDHTHRFVVTFIDIYLFFSKLPAWGEGGGGYDAVREVGRLVR